MTELPVRPDIDTWALDLCEAVARRSRDPSTKVGSVILRPDNTIAAAGYNGFPRKVDDDPEIYLDKLGLSLARAETEEAARIRKNINPRAG